MVNRRPDSLHEEGKVLFLHRSLFDPQKKRGKENKKTKSPQLETYHGPGSPTVHGTTGPVHISDGGFRSKNIMDDMLQAASSMGYPEIIDLQDLDSNNGYQRWLRNNSPEGKRQDTAHRYLHPLLHDEDHRFHNLHVLVETKVLRVLFDADDDENRATGVEFIPNPEFTPTTTLPGPNPGDTPRRVNARKLVVLSAGACGTPLILERSGVGNFEILAKAGIEKPLVDLPGVGHDYQDHHLTAAVYKTTLGPEDTPDELYAGQVAADRASVKETPQTWIEQNNSKRAWNTVDVAAKIRPTEDEVKALGPEFEEAWKRDFGGNMNRPLMLSAVLAGYDPPPVFLGLSQTSNLLVTNLCELLLMGFLALVAYLSCPIFQRANTSR